MNAYLYGFGASGGTGGTLTVTAPAGVTVIVFYGQKQYTKTADASGVAVFKGLKSGTWGVTITDGTQTATKTVEITTDYSTVMSFNQIPSFDYSGDCEIVNDADEPITVSQDNWKIRFLTSGTLTFTELNGAEDGIDVFCVGGGGGGGARKSTAIGGGGGGGGFTTTQKAIKVTTGTPYEIIVGAGGAVASNGGETSAFGVSALGGNSSQTVGNGGSGGSGGGGGGYSYDYAAGEGGSDGASGSDVKSGGTGGDGQGTTTREFGSSSNTLYAGGGAGGTGYGKDKVGETASGGEGGGGSSGSEGVTNTGGGGGGQAAKGNAAASGGSGIVIIRNAREVA